jgi:hypothetical protein
MLAEADREAFVLGPAEVIEGFGGRVERLFEMVLVAAQLRA